MILSVEEERLWSKVDVRGKDECWNWVAKAKTQFGYGVINLGGKMEGAHRFAWESWNKASIPKGMQVMHACDNPACCNPHHLSVGTRSDNMSDAARKRRFPKQHITHCPKGHEYTPENTFNKGGEARGCRACQRAAHARRYANPEYAAAKSQYYKARRAAKNPNYRPRRSKFDGEGIGA